jgi:hypothetical protein
MLLCLFLLIFTLFFEAKFLNAKRSKMKIVKMIGKTSCQPYPKDWWPFTPTTTVQDDHLKVTRTIPYGSLNFILPNTLENYETEKLYEMKPTKFVDFRKSKAYKKLLERTNLGLNWFPPEAS